MSTELETRFGGSFGGERDLRRAVLGALGIVAFTAVWWVAALFNPAFVLPAPDAVAGGSRETRPDSGVPVGKGKQVVFSHFSPFAT